MTPLPLTLNDLECHFCSLKPFYFSYLGKYYLRYVYTWIGKRTWLVISTVYFEIEGLLKVTDSHVRCKCDGISETLQDRVNVTIDHWEEVIYTACQIAAIPMTLSDLQGHSPTANLFKWDLSFSCAAVDLCVGWKTSTYCVVEALMDLGSEEDQERSGWTVWRKTMRPWTWIWLKLLDWLKQTLLYDTWSSSTRGGLRHRRKALKSSQACRTWHDFNWHSASRGPSAIAEFLVFSCFASLAPWVRGVPGSLNRMIPLRHGDGAIQLSDQSLNRSVSPSSLP